MASTGKLYVPTEEQILRLAYVAGAGFYHSPVNAYERPNRNECPHDTIASYANELLDFLVGSDTALLAIEDIYQTDELQQVYPALREYMERENPASSKPDKTDSKVIVGFVCLNFRLGTGKHGLDPKGSLSASKRFEDRERDRNAEGKNRLSAALAAPMKKHLANQFTVDMLAVHPAYWRRGHGTTLLKEATMLADKDQIPLGIASVEMGVKNCKAVGFKECEVVEVEGYSQHPGSFKVWIGIREPSKV